MYLPFSSEVNEMTTSAVRNRNPCVDATRQVGNPGTATVPSARSSPVSPQQGAEAGAAAAGGGRGQVVGGLWLASAPLQLVSPATALKAKLAPFTISKSSQKNIMMLLPKTKEATVYNTNLVVHVFPNRLLGNTWMFSSSGVTEVLYHEHCSMKLKSLSSS